MTSKEAWLSATRKSVFTFSGVAKIGATGGMGRDAIAVWTGGVGRGWARKGVSLGAVAAASEDSARAGEETTWTT